MSGSYYSKPPPDPKEVAAKVEAGVSASTKEASSILREIHKRALDATVSDTQKLADVMAMFATLVVSLSIKADRMQVWMIILTVLIAIMTALLLVIAYVSLCRA